MSENSEAAAEAAGEQTTEEPKVLTQADVDRIVKERIARVEAKYADYNDLKAAAEGKQTVEQKLADLEQKHAEAEARALRSDIAAKHGLSPEDRDLFLTGTDEATLEAQASRLAARTAASKTAGNVAPSEGDTKSTAKPEDVSAREFAGQLFGGGDDN